MKKDLEKFLYHLRIEASVEVIEMSDTGKNVKCAHRDSIWLLQMWAPTPTSALSSWNSALKFCRLTATSCRWSTLVKLNRTSWTFVECKCCPPLLIGPWLIDSVPWCVLEQAYCGALERAHYQQKPCIQISHHQHARNTAQDDIGQWDQLHGIHRGSHGRSGACHPGQRCWPWSDHHILLSYNLCACNLIYWLLRYPLSSNKQIFIVTTVFNFLYSYNHVPAGRCSANICV